MKKTTAILLVLVLAATASAEFLGRYRINDYIEFSVNVHSASTGASAAADCNPTYYVFKDGVYLASQTGYLTNSGTAGTGDANITGLYSARIQLTAANGYATNSTYRVDVNVQQNALLASKSYNFQIPLTDFNSQT